MRPELPAHHCLLPWSRARERFSGARQVADPEHLLRAAQDGNDQLAGHGRHGWQARARFGRGGRAGSAPLGFFLVGRRASEHGRRRVCARWQRRIRVMLRFLGLVWMSWLAGGRLSWTQRARQQHPNRVMGGCRDQASYVPVLRRAVGRRPRPIRRICQVVLLEGAGKRWAMCACFCAPPLLP